MSGREESRMPLINQRKVVDGKLLCSICGPRPVQEFWVSAKGIFEGRCDTCRRIQQNARNNNVTPEKYREMTETGRCAICGQTGLRLTLDFDHITGRLRDALCIKCNSAIAPFEKGVDFLNRVNEYLQRWNDTPLTGAEAAEGAERARLAKVRQDRAAARLRAQKENLQPKNIERRQMKITRVQAAARLRAQKISNPQTTELRGAVVRYAELVIDALKNGCPTIYKIRKRVGLPDKTIVTCLDELSSQGIVFKSGGNYLLTSTLKPLLMPALKPIDPNRRLSDADTVRIFGVRCEWGGAR